MNKINIDNIKALLLDLDGTLINSEKAFFEAYKDILLKEYSVVISKDEYKEYELEQNAKLLDFKRNEYQSIRNISDDTIYQKLYANYMPFFESVIREEEAKDNFNLIKEIKDSGLIVALVTTCRRMYISKLLDLYDLHNTFDIIIARDDVPHELLKPNPAEYLIALDKLQLKPYECISIEDSKRGVDASIGASIPTIKVDNFTEIKYHDDRTIEESSANKVLRNILDFRLRRNNNEKN